MPMLLRFFLVAPPVPALMPGTFAAIGALGAAVLLLNAERGGAIMFPILVLQLFAAASGFAGPARRGHYDLLLTGGHSRVRVALAHWAVSAAPGAATWVLLGLLELALRGAPAALFAPGSAAAMALVSTLPWALSSALPRFAVSIAWLLIVVSASALTPDGLDGWARVEPGSRFGAAIAAAAFLLYPLSAVGRDLTTPEAPSVWPALSVAAAAMAAACWWTSRADYPLEASQ